MTQIPKKLQKIVYLKGKGESDSIAVSRKKKLERLARKATKESGKKVTESQWFRDRIDEAEV